MFKQLFIFASLTASAFCQNSPPVQSQPLSDDDETDFRNWMDRYNKSYNSENEFSHRFQIWKENNEKIQKHNKKANTSYTFGHNSYSDMTGDEFEAYFNIGNYSNLDPDTLFGTDEEKANDVSNHRRSLMEPINTNLPDEVDWTAAGAVTCVKSQSSCSSCWAFGAVGALEGAHYLKTGQLIDLSEQQLVDCDRYPNEWYESGNEGCNRGNEYWALDYVMKNGGICSELDYPYTASEGTCHDSSCNVVEGTAFARTKKVKPGDVDAMMTAIAVQPVTAAITANADMFQFYSSGIVDSEYCFWHNVNHVMLFTGYGTDPETWKDYFTIKNSWGKDWGEDGYLRVARRTDCKFGVYMILAYANYPVLD